MDVSRPERLTASEAARAIASGALSAVQLVEACLARIREVEPTVQAWQYLDEPHALAQARARDLDRAEGRACGPLHGVPVGIKDIIDTTDMPTYAPGKTRNPHDPTRTPGGSSSGSAAAVAAAMVPLAVGTQSNASIIRPAAFCGVYGFKPTHGLISRHGILKLSRALDCVGVFGRSLDDVALAAEQLTGFDENDADTRPRARIPLQATLASEPPLTPRVALVKTPVWERADESTRQAFGELAAALGAQCQDYPLPESIGQAWDWHRTIMEAEMALNLDLEYEKGRERLSESLRGQLARGREISALAYQRALAKVPRLIDGFDELFANFDAIVTPATLGTAPPLQSTGDPAFGTLWTLTGMPALSLPLMHGPDGLPLGVQLVGKRHDDARLLRTARWLQAQLASA
jgi:Asp-tRNA(Asn)/Glu-tRNA(Gln) amidotransferase A subunit family amidase